MAPSQPKVEAKGESTEVEEIAQTTLEYRIWVLKTNIHCDGCRKKIHRTLKSIDGVYRIEVDVRLQKVTVIGNVDAEALIKKLAKEGKPAELWPGQNANCSLPNDKKKSKGKGKQKGSPETSENSNHGRPDGLCDGEKAVGSCVKNNGQVNVTSKNSGGGTAPAKNGGGGGQAAKNGGGGSQPAKNGGGGGNGAPANNGGGDRGSLPSKNGGGGRTNNGGGRAPENNGGSSGTTANNGGHGGASANSSVGAAPAKNGGGGPPKNGGGGGAPGNIGGDGSGPGKNDESCGAPGQSGRGGGQMKNQSTIAEDEDTDNNSDWEDEESGRFGRANSSGGNSNKNKGPSGNGNADVDDDKDGMYGGAPPNTETAIVPNEFRMLTGPNGPPGPRGPQCFLGPQGLGAPYGPLGPVPGQSPANINLPRQNLREYQFCPSQPYFGPPVGPFPGSYNNAAIPAGYGASHYDAPPPFSQSFSYEPSRSQAGNEPQSYAPQEFYPSQSPYARPSDSFHFFSDENPNGCTIM